MKRTQRLWNIYYCFADFLKSHKIKLIVLLAVFITACAFGVRIACGADAETVLSERVDLALPFNAEQRNAVAFLFFNLLCYVLCFGVLIITGFNFWLALGGVFVFFHISYTVGYNITVCISYFKLAALPFVIIAYVPFYAIVSFAAACAVSLAFECGCENRKRGCCDIQIIKERLPVFSVAVAAMAVSVIYLGIAGGIFSIGLAV